MRALKSFLLLLNLFEHLAFALRAHYDIALALAHAPTPACIQEPPCEHLIMVISIRQQSQICQGKRQNTLLEWCGAMDTKMVTMYT